MFRTELLLAQAMDLDLLRPLTTVLALDQAEPAQAASRHLRHLTSHRGFLQDINYPKLRAELRDWNARDDEDLTEEESERLSYVAWQVNAYEQTYGLLNDSFFSLVALGFSSSCASREHVLSALHNQSWATKHEVLTRWGWMLEHKELLGNRESPDKPFSCQVALRGRPGRRLDKEYYQLLDFLHFLRAAEGRELLFVSKHETPDFILEDGAVGLVGAEMTEASISDEWDRESDAEEEVLAVVRSALGERILCARLQKPDSWLPLAGRLDDLKRWLRSEFQRVEETPDRAIHLNNEEIGLALEVSRRTDGRADIFLSDHRGQTGADIERETQELQKTLRDRIEKKIARIRNGRRIERQRPAIVPSYLVVYPNAGLGPDLKKAVREFLRRPPIDVSTHFERVYLSGEGSFVQLM